MLDTIRRQIVTYRQKFILSVGIVIIFSLINNTNSAPLSDDKFGSKLEQTDLSSSPSSSKKRTLDTGSDPSDLAWQAWLLFDNEGQTDPRIESDSAIMVRRITPKSIFIAPPLPACPDGYESDHMNRCVKNVNIDHDAHINFLIERLNTMFANVEKPKLPPQPPSTKSPSSSTSSSIFNEASDPFQFTVPLISNSDNNDTPQKVNVDTEISDDTFMTFSSHSNEDIGVKPIISNNEETIVTVYDIKDTKKQGEHAEKDEKIFFIENQYSKIDNNNNKNAPTDDEKFIPIVEFMEDTNSNITDILDYNIPVISLSEIQNGTEITNQRNVDNENINNDEISNKHTSPLSNDTSVSSTLVLVLPSKHSALNITNYSDSFRNKSNDKVIIDIEHKKNQSLAQETISINFSQENTTYLPPIEVFFNNTNTTNVSTNVEESTIISIDERPVTEHEKETSYYLDEDTEEHEHTRYPIEDEDFDASTESEDEILKHSEARISVTMPNIYIKPSLIPLKDDENNTVRNIPNIVIINDDFIGKTTLNIDSNINEKLNKSKDLIINDKKTFINFTNDEKVVVITPKSKYIMKTTPPPKEIISFITPNNEDITDSTVIANDITTEIPADTIQIETTFPSTTQTDEVSYTNTHNINPVISIEEVSTENIINQQQQTSSTKTSKVVISNSNNDTQTAVTHESDKFEMISSPTNAAKVVLSHSEDKVSPLTSLVDEAHNTKYIHESIPPKLEKLNKPSSTPSFNNDKQLYNHGSVSQPNYNRDSYVIDSNHAIIKTIDDQSLGLNNNRNNRPTFFPNTYGSAIDSSKNYVRFPTYKRPHTRPGYVRFPSEDANSIHTRGDLKEKSDHQHHPYALLSIPESRRTGTVVAKQSNWNIPPGRKLDRHQQLPQRSKSNVNGQRQRNRSSMFMKFWAKMPLVKDPSFHYHSTYPTVVPVDTEEQNNDEQLHSSRMVNLYDEILKPDETWTFAQRSVIDF